MAHPCSSVLVVEDEPLLRSMLAAVIEEAGRPVIAVATAEEAIDALITTNAIALVITDMTLPGAFSGTDLANWMRKDFGTIPVIITSGDVSRVQDASSNPAVVRIVSKPFSALDVDSWLSLPAVGFCEA